MEDKVDKFQVLCDDLKKVKLLGVSEAELQASPDKRKIYDALNQKVASLDIDDDKKYLPFLLELQKIYVESLPDANPALKKFLGHENDDFKACTINQNDLLFVQLHILAEAAGNKEESVFELVRDERTASHNAASTYAQTAFVKRATASKQARVHADNLLMSYHLNEANPENLPRRIAEVTPGDLTVEDYIAIHKNSNHVNKESYDTLLSLFSDEVNMGSAKLAPNCCFDKVIRPVLSALTHDISALIHANQGKNPDEMVLLNKVANLAEEVREFSAKMKILAAKDHLDANSDILYQVGASQFKVEEDKKRFAEQAQSILKDINEQWETTTATTAARVLGGLFLVLGLLVMAAAAASLLVPAATATALSIPTLAVSTKATIGGIGFGMAVIGGVTLYRNRDPSIKKNTIKAANACAKQAQNLKFEPSWQENLKPQLV